MKKQIVTYLLLLTAIGAFPQEPTLTSTNSAPQPGDFFTRYNADTTGIVSGNPGAGQTWNFSNLVMKGTNFVLNYVAPSTTPYAALFPDATVSFLDSVGSGYYLYGYYKVTLSEYACVGLSSNLNSWFYSDPEVYFTYPFSYGSNLVDSLYATSFVLGINNYRIGTRTTIADGYGTLILPSGTYNNLLRVKVIQNYSDSSSTKVVHVYEVSYCWYDGVNKSPALTISTLSNTTGGSTTTVKMVHISSVVNGIADNKTPQKAVTLYPNPATDKVTIILPDTRPTGKSMISIYNTDGLLLIQQPIHENPIELDISTLSSGLYIIKVTGNENITVSKLIKV